jgi:outer membrane immunogenic protein
MKKFVLVGAFALLAGGQALAADLPPPVAPPPRAPAAYMPAPAPYYNWTGIYVGINGGYNFGTYSPNAPFTSTSLNGFLIGGTLGGNYQIGQFVVGLEGDGDYDSINNTTPFGATYKSNWLATVRGRAGYAWDRVLFYGTGGAAFAPVAHGGAPAFTGNTTMTGWTVGGGIEYAFLPNWTAKAEYLYINFPSQNLSLPALNLGFKTTDNVVRAGVNYKFSW